MNLVNRGFCWSILLGGVVHLLLIFSSFCVGGRVLGCWVIFSYDLVVRMTGDHSIVDDHVVIRNHWR